MNMERYMVVKKIRRDGMYRLFYRGTSNEVYPGRSWHSAAVAREFHRSIRPTLSMITTAR